MRSSRGSVAPRLLDPVLRLVERIDRSRRHIRPAGLDSLLGVERRSHHGAPLTLADGTRVRPGDPVGVLHLDNARVRGLAGPTWQTRGYARARRDLHAIARWHARLRPGAAPVAYTGVTVLGPLARRAGFEVRGRPRTPRVRLEEWYLRSLLARWARGGRDRLARGRRPLRASQAWLSAAELLSRYGPPPE